MKEIWKQFSLDKKAQSTYVQPPNPALLFATSALNVANTYYSRISKRTEGLLTNQAKQDKLKQSLVGCGHNG